MADEGSDRRKHQRVGVNLTIRVSYLQVDDFIDHFATNISYGGIFIQSRKPHPVGTKLRFEIQLKGGQAVLKGMGEVTWVRSAGTGEKPQPPGMGIKFTYLDDTSRSLVDKIIEIKQRKFDGTDPLRPEPAAAKAPPAAQRVPGPPPSALQPQEDELPEAEQIPQEAGTSLDIDVDLSEDSVAAAPLEVDVDIADEPPGGLMPTVEVPASPGDASTSDEFDVDVSLDEFVPTGPDQGTSSPPARRPSGGVSSRIIGIDLGTTNTCAAVVIDGKPQIIPTKKGYRTIPSVVAYTNDSRLLVGQAAKAQMELNPKNTVYGSKRLVGRPYDSPAVQQMKDRFHYEIIEGPKHEAAVRIVGRSFSLQQVAAFILSDIRDVARDLLGEEVNRTVITVPAYYNENQRQAVREAGMLAGLHVERILNEPTAAALAYGYNRGLDQRVMVFDLGGGTFDASVLEVYENVYEVVSTGGDTFLGGVDFDNQLVDHLIYSFCQQLGEVPALDRSAMQRLRDAAEQAKCALSEKEETIVRLPFFATVRNVPKDLEVRVSREILEELVGPLVERSLIVASNVLDRAKLQPHQLNNILLVGGQSRMPLIWRRIEEVFGKTPYKGVHPDEAVAIGAALLADSQGKIDSVVLIDVLPMSIGIGIPGGRFFRILEAGTSLPATKSNTIRTFKDNQDAIELTIFQGESDRVVDNEYLGTVTISGVTPAPKGSVQLEITFSLDQECLLQVSSRELNTGKITQTRMATKDTQDSIRKKLQIPEGEVSRATYGVKIPPRRSPQEAPQPAPEVGKDGLLGKLFGRKK